MPNPVQNAMARPINTTSIRVTWSHPDGLKDYYLYSVETCESSGNCTDIGNTTNTSYDVFGLEPGSNYNISIRTIVDSDSESSPVEVSSYTSKDFGDYYSLISDKMFTSAFKLL